MESKRKGDHQFYQQIAESSQDIDIEKSGHDITIDNQAQIISKSNLSQDHLGSKIQNSSTIKNGLQQIQSVECSEDSKVTVEMINTQSKTDDTFKHMYGQNRFRSPHKQPVKGVRVKKRIKLEKQKPFNNLTNQDQIEQQIKNFETVTSRNDSKNLTNFKSTSHNNQEESRAATAEAVTEDFQEQIQTILTPQTNNDEFRLPPIQGVKNQIPMQANDDSQMTISGSQEIEIKQKKFQNKKNSVSQGKTNGKLEEQGDIFEQSEQSNSAACLNALASPKNRTNQKDQKVKDSNKKNQLANIMSKELYRRAAKCLHDTKINTNDLKLSVNNKNFQKYSTLYQNFTNRQGIHTHGCTIVDILINQKSDRVLCLMKESDSIFVVNQYSIDNYEVLNNLEIRGEYIKANKIEQNEEGNLFAIAYIDDGFWRFVVFNYSEVIVDYDVNANFNFDNHTVPIMGFQQPFASCCFLKNNNLFFNFFYRPTKTHNHLVFNPFKKKVVQDLQQSQFKCCTDKNFPQRCYFDSINSVIYIMYRQGYLVTVESDKCENFTIEKISEQAFGDTLMYKHKIIIVESGQQILFFKKEFILNEEKQMWVNYHSIDSNGFISGDNRINAFQIIEDANIKFYQIDDITSTPSLKNVMVNFMQVNMIIFGVKGQFCIQYKRSHENFQIFKSMCFHDFRANVKNNNFEGAMGISVHMTNYFIVAKQGSIYTYSDSSYDLISKVQLNLEQSTTREALEIISMSISNDCRFVAIIVGKQLIKDEELITKMIIMKRTPKSEEQTYFEIFKEINMVDFELTNVCKKLHFDNTDSKKLIFVTEDQIITFDFISEQIDTLYDFANDFTEQPEFFVFNDRQDVCIIASTIDTLMINLNTYDEVDLDLIYGLKDIKKLIFDDRYFYILANNKNGMIGIFLLKLEQNKSSELIADNQKDVDERFLLNTYTKLSIGDSDMCIRNGDNTVLGNKQLLLSYKSIYINVYSIFVLDLQTGILIYRHESSCLWESKITSFFIKRTKDYISLSAEGMAIMSLHGVQMKKQLMDDRNKRHLVHSLPSFNYLKLEKQNSIRFECSRNYRIVTVQNQYKCGFGYTKFEDLYKLDVCQLQLRELLILQSIFHSDETLQMFNLIKSQGNYSIFFRSYLELDGQNMVSILAFDNNTIQQLLQEKNKEYFRVNYPLFYNNKQLTQIWNNGKSKKTYIITNAIDTALESNKIRAVGMILDHIVNYQNNYVSSYLFNYNLIVLMERGIKVHKLLDSDVFSFKFQYPEWPSAHTDTKTTIKPYNGSIFDIRYSYAQVFEKLGDPINSANSQSTDRFYKITYTLNLLPRIQQTIVNSNISFSKLCEDRTCQDLQIFSSQSLQQLISYKWQTHAFFLHYFGALMHGISILIISCYIYNTYLIGTYGECTQVYLIGLMALGIIYPASYDAYQLYQQKMDFFEDPWNYSDLLFHFSSILNIIFQVVYKPWHPASTITLSIVIALALVKTMFFLRIFDNLAYLVTLIREVIYDLKVFMLLYIIMVYMFSLILGVLGWQNYTRDPELWNTMQETMKYPGVEYYHIGRFLGNILTIARMSIGDNDFAASHYMSDHVCNLLVWLLWAGLLFIMVIIFLNFIIAEACASYEKVRKNLDSFLQYQKLTLINESEDMMWPELKNKERFPQYLIIRQKED